MRHYIGYVVSMCIINILLEYLNNRDNISKNPDQSDYNYVVKIPSALKYTYLTMFGVGIFLFVVFLFFFLQGNPTVTIGHLNFAVIFASIGFVVALWSERWRLVVDNEQLEIHRLFHRPRQFTISDISKIEIGKKHQIILYDWNGKKLLTVDVLSDNYDRLKKTLKCKIEYAGHIISAGIITTAKGIQILISILTF